MHPDGKTAELNRNIHGVETPLTIGDLTPTEGAYVMNLIETYRRTLETTELEARLAALEGARA